MSDIVERLRSQDEIYENKYVGVWSVDENKIEPLCVEAADTIEALRAENARLMDCYKGSTYTVDVLIKDNAKLREALGLTLGVCIGDTMTKSGLEKAIRAARAAMGESDG